MKLAAAFVGVDHYRDARISDLQFAGADAELFHRTVSSGLAPGEVQTWILRDEAATKTEILRTFGETIPQSVSQEDIVLLYFSGHGSPETCGGIDDVSRYLISYDTNYDSIFSTAIDVERELVRVLERLPVGLVLVVIDACFSGRAGGRTFEGPQLSSLRALHREAVKLSALELGMGRVMISACDDDQVAYEESALRHGVFTHYFLDALTDGSSPGGTISLSQLYEHVQTRVRTHSKGRQTPVMNGRLVGAKFPVFPRLA